MADANPGIGGLSAATRLTLEEFRNRADGRCPGRRWSQLAAATRRRVR